MEKNESRDLDTEFERYLEILRPYLYQLEEDVLDLCKSWIERLSNGKENEKSLRNKYIGTLCFQLTQAYLREPFLSNPPLTELPSIPDELNDSSISSEYVTHDSMAKTKVLYGDGNFSKNESKTEFLSRSNDLESAGNIWQSDSDDNLMFSHDNLPAFKERSNNYNYRTSNLLMKLRKIKMQNVQLHRELQRINGEKILKCNDQDVSNTLVLKVDNGTDALSQNTESQTSLKAKSQEIKDSKFKLIQTIKDLQSQLDHLSERKRREIDNILTNNKLELVECMSKTHDEAKRDYEGKLNEMQIRHETVTAELKLQFANELKIKDNVILEKDRIIKVTGDEISYLKNQLSDQKDNLNSVLNKLFEKSDSHSMEKSERSKVNDLEKRLSKVEKSKMKFAKTCEAQIQKEKQFWECSLQLQLVKQRTQIINDMTDENNSDLKQAIDKLEVKYKEIVANVQSTAIQRRIQDQLAIETVLHACGIQNVNVHSSFAPASNHKNFKADRNENQCSTFGGEMSTLLQENKVGNVGMNKSFDENSVFTGYCLDSERIELLERVYPQRDIEDRLQRK